ncbi:MFS transporter [Vreelandella titanicae]|jgi:MFS family permease|uniref:Major facilitator superfamily, general substrate transporter n=1 Tax=Vreelandella titanicae BH1 TaxID=1204738 RepID=L9U948_9GAMM|nr:MFS transporter [Halomonas titanicae]NAO98415.1 MFS transporter [Halomonas sp. MG34]UEQ02521.1 MFS transporter [Halomonas profundus]ELY20773.1 Major facilitator superfamily, general substrate transporter [Halomonas titanicae BH1]MCE7521082.1 MFS transporter [Halomonas titanicae]NVE92615.1 MFS transporter [Halomonas titanicae]|tara:strand:- start:310 stop:1599 length:1290 start_codon:yes stop_codon:yes gene_type:complete
MTNNNTATLPNTPNNTRYQILLVTLLSLNFGIVFFDRNALNFLMPFVQPELALTNLQIGLTASALSVTWAISGLIFGAMSDRSGRRKIFLIMATIVFSLCSFLSGLATSFLLLLGARLLMGVAEGPILPISQSVTAIEVTPERRGIAMGVMQNFGSNLLGSFAAPVVLVAVASAFGWREAFFLAGLPGLLAAGLLWWLMREPTASSVPIATGVNQSCQRPSLKEVFAHRNMLLCSLIAVLLIGYLVTCWSFMPIYLTSVRGYSAEAMGWLMGTLGISAAVGSFVVSGISDKIGRKPVMVITPFMGLILTLSAMYFDGSAIILAVLFFFGWALNGIFPLFMATVPSETVDSRHIATALGFVMGIGEILGGGVLPALAGAAADSVGQSAPLWLMSAICVIAGVLALGLKETAPAVLVKRAQAPDVSASFSS